MSDFSQVQKEIEEAFRTFKKCKDPERRRALLAEMRLLLEKADQLNTKLAK